MTFSKLQRSSEGIKQLMIQGPSWSSWVAVIFTLIVLVSPNFAQDSSRASIENLQSTFETLQKTLVASLQSLPYQPNQLADQTIARNILTLRDKDLPSLMNQIQQQKQLLVEKQAKVTNDNALAETDKTELKAALANQKKPLDALKTKVAALQDAVAALADHDLKQWDEEYKAFKDVQGEQEACKKLKDRVDTFCAPYLPKPTPTPTPKSTPTPEPTPTPTPYRKPYSYTNSVLYLPTSTPRPSYQNNGYDQQPASPSSKILSFNDALQRADQGDAYAQAVVSIYYALGYMTDKNMELASKYAILSAKQGNPLGIYRLGVMRQDGEGGIQQDQQQGIALKSAAFQGLNNMSGDPYAITALGIMCFRGEGVQKNLTEAAELYKIAADMGYAPAQYTYSVCLVSGQGVPKNPYAARIYWQNAYNQGYGPALKGMPTP